MVQTFSLGAAALVFAIAEVLTLTISAFLLSRYRKALDTAMHDKAGVPPPLSPNGPPPLQSSPVHMRIVQVHEARANRNAPPLAITARRRNRIAAQAYAVAGLASAAAATAVFLLLSQVGFLPGRTVIIFFVYSWPVIVALNLFGGPDRKAQFRRIAAYFAVLALLGTVEGLLDPLQPVAVTLRNVAVLWIMWMLAPTVLLYPLLTRSIRAVGPVVFVFMTIAVFGANAAMGALATDAAMHRVARWSARSNTPVELWVIAIALLGFVVFCLLAMPIVRALRASYESKKTSDTTLTLDCMFLVYTLFATTAVVNRGFIAVLALLPFACYKLISRAALRSVAADVALSPATPLLLLRVFGNRARTRRMLDVTGSRWRYIGSIQMIAADDAAADFIGIGQFIAYLRRKLRQYFVRSAGDLDRRMQMLDRAPDRDGRFRVNMFFCHDDTWRMTVQRLIGESPRILMDLRGFSDSNRGCKTELQALFESVDLDRVLLLIDRSTKREQLLTALTAAYTGARRSRPDLPIEVGVVTALEAAGDGETAAAVLSLLCSGIGTWHAASTAVN